MIQRNHQKILRTGTFWFGFEVKPRSLCLCHHFQSRLRSLYGRAILRGSLIPPLIRALFDALGIATRLARGGNTSGFGQFRLPVPLVCFYLLSCLQAVVYPSHTGVFQPGGV